MSDRRPGTAIQRLPLPALFVVAVVIWAGGQLVFTNGPITLLRIVLDVIGGVVIATVVTIAVGSRRRRLGGTDASLEYTRAVRSGERPEGADTSRWSAEIDRSEARLRRDRWIVRIGGLLPFGLGIWGVTEADSRVLGIVLAIAMVAGWVYTEISFPRALARMERLRRSVD